MKKLCLLLLACLLAGCGRELTHEQMRSITDACHAAGLEYKVQYTQVVCWASSEKKQ